MVVMIKRYFNLPLKNDAKYFIILDTIDEYVTSAVLGKLNKNNCPCLKHKIDNKT